MTVSIPVLVGTIVLTVVLVRVYSADPEPYAVLVLVSPKQVHTTKEECTYTDVDHTIPQVLPSIYDAPMTQLSVVVPMYNEEKRLPAMLDDALAYLEELRKNGIPLAGKGATPTSPDAPVEPLTSPLTSYELLLVDDGSRDTTYATALKYAKQCNLPSGASIRITRLFENCGKGAAVRHGVMHASGAFVLFADADGATRFADLTTLAAEMVRILTPAGHAIVAGSRAHLVTSDAVVKRSVVRNFLMRSFHFLLSILLRPPSLGGLWEKLLPSSQRAKEQRTFLPLQPRIQDTQCGFKLFARATARLLFPFAHIDRWIFDVELILLAEMAGRASEHVHIMRAEATRGEDVLLRLPLPVAEVAVQWEEIDGSKISLFSDSILMARDLVVIRTNYTIGRWRKPPSIYAP
ncbi:dolichyl-phosphate beta-glucosyltransferase [Malassezia vespertilionis]|uniref:dolichyl-phosphate beta-glucosyltransferase n=1 Tax=Malassezia vespertilionis TaxID=2020962 RepID=A0A2N1JD29_9BASI|nr:dolichyl-phosphate beta-glucosyltransferase [Malassezia vespertilionis]PKI84439.1 Alg5p [Malassezia vespertilionis]WFD06239.1 dolichyl-phosphate beta-glucosyltransferase [Malassezia vespertilionis]